MGYINETFPNIYKTEHDNFQRTLNIGVLSNRRTIIKPQNTDKDFADLLCSFSRLIYWYITIYLFVIDNTQSPCVQDQITILFHISYKFANTTHSLPTA